MKQHRGSLSIVALLAIASVGSVLFWHHQSAAQDRRQLLVQYIATLDEIVSTSRQNFYKDVDEAKMLEGAIRGAVAALNDPHSFYQSPAERQREAENLFQAKFGGLGIRIYAEPHADGRAVVKISKPLRNSPATKHDLRSGDVILQVNGEPVILGGPSGLSMDDVVSRLRGPVGEPVTITVERRNWGKPFDVTLVREEIKLESVEWTPIQPGIAYISVESFTGSTMEEFAKALAEIQQEMTLRAIILDLRGNRGGLLGAAKEVADAFLSDGVIVSTRGKQPQFNHVYKADPPVLLRPNVELVVLVDGDSASGSEIVAGAVKDLKRGVIVGAKTFGKGVVQERFVLENKGAVSLTISSYYTSNGTSIDGEGILPHVALEAETLTDQDSFYLGQVRSKGLIEKFVLDYVAEYERQHDNTPPRDFGPLLARLPDMIAAIEKAGLHLDSRVARLEARRIFNLNVGNDPLIDLENDRQLAEAVHILRDVGVAQVLSGNYRVASQGAATTN
jgi:carboxyl-terminal processing protease